MELNLNEQAQEVRRNFENYDQEGDVPLKQYGIIISFFTTAFSVAYYLSHRNKRVKKRISAADLFLLGIGSHKLSRHITKDKVTSVFRAPFTKRGENTGVAEVRDISLGTGWKRAMADLITCPICLGMWTSTVLGFGLLWAPRLTRFVCSVLTIDTISDSLQIGYGKLKKD